MTGLSCMVGTIPPGKVRVLVLESMEVQEEKKGEESSPQWGSHPSLPKLYQLMNKI